MNLFKYKLFLSGLNTNFYCYWTLRIFRRAKSLIVKSIVKSGKLPPLFYLIIQHLLQLLKISDEYFCYVINSKCLYLPLFFMTHCLSLKTWVEFFRYVIVILPRWIVKRCLSFKTFVELLCYIIIIFPGWFMKNYFLLKTCVQLFCYFIIKLPG